VRSLEREIGSICRKIVTRIAEGKLEKVEIDPAQVAELLGKPKHFYMTEIEERTNLPGVATGLVWTPVGGDVIFVEAAQMPGSKGFTLTGQLGDVMQESARAALSYVRSRSPDLNIPDVWFDQHDIHMHVPAGSVPKDGPSAGITMATALASLLTGRPVRSDIAMTGEITLRGQVLPVGGIKEKIVAAHRFGIGAVILPQKNMRDIEDIPAEVRDQMAFIPVQRVDEVLAIALAQEGAEKPATSPRPAAAKPVSRRKTMTQKETARAQSNDH
jgi:ATP-dependent Lon protease